MGLSFRYTNIPPQYFAIFLIKIMKINILKMNKIKYILFASILIIMASCTETQLQNYFTPVVDIPIPAHISKLVVQAEWITGSDSLAVMVSKSRGALDTSYFNLGKFDTVGDLKVELLRDNKIVATIPYYRDGYQYLRGGYRLDSLPNSTYTIRASAPTFTTVEATQSIPSLVKIKSVAFNKQGAVRADPLDIFEGKPRNKTVDEYVIEFDDAVNVENYYSAYAIIQSVVNGQVRRLELNSLDDIAESNMLKDKTFQNRTFKWRLWGGSFGRGSGPNGNNNGIYTGDKITFYLRSLTADEFLFRRSLDLYKQADNFFSEPVILHSNMKNGYGIFSITSLSSMTITAP